MKKNNNKGFSLVELAIVLVIIGLIIGAVLKGQDLIDNAKTKKFITKSRAWEVSQWAYLDRKGVFTGDTDEDGKIGDGNVKEDFTGAMFTNPPYETGEANTISMGSLTYYVFFGTDGTAAGKNIMTICSDVACGAFDDAELLHIEALDVAIDGSSSGTSGQLVGIAAAPDTITDAEWEAVYDTTPTPAAWSTDITTLIYYFDAKR